MQTIFFYQFKNVSYPLRGKGEADPHPGEHRTPKMDNRNTSQGVTEQAGEQNHRQLAPAQNPEYKEETE
jgi:hypothetical protein